ncbi:hypothetical protein [Paenibacillus sp. 1_12]|uniref:hypothetical protein n=1 Tax=Paenibacillus sp. 1_12 TaxID=1566278 RepID=UPI000B889943|nr:hypothetical protein [Paenibacillus sp. 1_12]
MLLNGQMLQLSRKHALLLLPGMKAVINRIYPLNLKRYRVSFELFRHSESTNSYRRYEKERSFPV